MGNKFDKVVGGLFVGDIYAARDEEALLASGVTHVLSLRRNPVEQHPDTFSYLLVTAEDYPGCDMTRHYRRCTDFIHEALLSDGSVLIYCLAGISSSPTIACVYLMTATGMGLEEVLTAVKKVRNMVNPSHWFLQQLRAYEKYSVRAERKRLEEVFPKSADLKLRLEQEMGAILSQ